MFYDLLEKHPEILNKFISERIPGTNESPKFFWEYISREKQAVLHARKTRQKHSQPKRPKPGDAPEGLEIDANEQQYICDLIVQFGEEEARRLGRPDPTRLIAPQWAKFNRRFNLSTYKRLPKTKYDDAIKHLKGRLLVQQCNEAKFGVLERERNGIIELSKSFGWDLKARRNFCYGLTGKLRLGQMSPEEIHKVYDSLRRHQRVRI